MRPQDMPSTGDQINAIELSKAVCKAISHAEYIVEVTKGESTTGDELRAFLLACAKLCPRSKKEPK